MKLLLVLIAAGAAFASERPTFSKTDTVSLSFPANGLLRIDGSLGEMRIEGWDRDDVQVAATKTATNEHESDVVHVTLTPGAAEVLLRTEYPTYGLASPPLPPKRRFQINYAIHVPHSANLTIEHGSGDVHVDGVRGNIAVNLSRGQITLLLPQDQTYRINAKTSIGSVYSDYAANSKSRFLKMGRTVAGTDSSAIHTLSVRVGFGDIILYQAHDQHLISGSTTAGRGPGL